MKLVEGKIFLGRDIGSFSGAVANIFLLDVSLLDASSRIVARETLSGVSHDVETEESLPFAIYGEKPDEGRQYSIRVHISLDGSDEVEVGDYVTTESYPVLFREYPGYITVTVRRVN